MNDVNFLWLQKWYSDNCNGDWEHSFGINIVTLDNFGWEFVVDLEGTEMEGKTFQNLEIIKSPTDWLQCGIKSKQFVCKCSSKNLSKICRYFALGLI